MLDILDGCHTQPLVTSPVSGEIAHLAIVFCALTKETIFSMYSTYRSCFYLLIVMLVVMVAGTTVAQDEGAFQPTILEDGIPVQGVLEDIYTAVVYAFHGSEGDTVRISMNEQTKGLDPYLVLVGENGDLLAFDDNSGADEGGERNSALISAFELPYDGSYYVIATSFTYIDGMFGEVGPAVIPLEFEITASGMTLPDGLEDFDPAVTTFTAFSPEPGVPLEVELTVEQPIAFVVFEGEEGDIVNIEVAADSFQPTPIIHLFAPDGRRVAMNEVLDGDSQTGELVDIELPVDGQYLFMTMDVFFVDRLQDPTGNYGLGSLVITVS
jgi:hypothetical protein